MTNPFHRHYRGRLITRPMGPMRAAASAFGGFPHTSQCFWVPRDIRRQISADTGATRSPLAPCRICPSWPMCPICPLAPERYLPCARAWSRVSIYRAPVPRIPTPSESQDGPLGSPPGGDLVPLKQAARTLGVSCSKLTAAASAGIFPTYAVGERTNCVRISEILVAIDCSADGGWR